MVCKVAVVKDEEHLSGSIILEIKGMTCSKCEDAIRDAFLKCNGVKDARVSIEEAEATIKVDIFKVDVNELKEAAEGTGYSVGTIYFNTAV